MFHILKSILAGQNQFASGGLLLMIIGGISVWLRAIPAHIWAMIVRQTTMVVTVKDDDAAFTWIKEWFLEQKFLKRVRHVDLDTTLHNERISMLPAPGKHRFWLGSRPFEVWFSRSESSREYSHRRVETFTFRTIGRNRACLQRFVDDVVLCHIRRQGVQSHLYVYNEGWERVYGYSPRILDSVVLEPGEKEYLLQDITQFRESRERYARLGVPYHRGYLFYGPPGTGKTSLVSAVGAHFGLSIYIVNLSEFTDRTLMSSVNNVPRNSILLFEDIDCMQNSQSRAEGKEGMAKDPKQNVSALSGVTLSG